MQPEPRPAPSNDGGPAFGPGILVAPGAPDGFRVHVRIVSDVLELVPVTKIKPAVDNIRSDLGDLEGLAQSIRSVGLIEPIVVQENGTGFDVVVGHRRLAAAKLAKLKEIPCVVRARAETPERTAAMIVENLQRLDVAPFDEARAFRRLVDMGWSQPKIAEQVGCTQPHVSKRLALLVLPADVEKQVHAGGIPIAGALALTKIAAEPKRISAAVKTATSWSEKPEVEDFEEAVEQELAEVQYEHEVKELRAELEGKGTTIVDATTDEHNDAVKLPAGMLEVTNSNYAWHERIKMEPGKHSKLPCAAKAIGGRRSPRVLEVCTDPGKHPKQRTRGSGGQAPPGPLSDKDKEARRAKRAHNAELREAAERRWEFVEALVAKRPGPALRDAASAMFVALWSDREPGVSWSNRGRSACRLLGLDPRRREYQGPDYPGAVLRYLGQNPDELHRVMLAITFGQGEDAITSDHPVWNQQLVKEYFALLKEHGYETSSAERLELAGKAPR